MVVRNRQGLDASRVGILVITPENQESAWLLFEAGALAKNLDRSKVCPLLFGGMEPTDVKGPLVQFQAAKFSKEEMKRVMKMINDELGEAGLVPDVLDSVFEMWWSKLETDVVGQLDNLNVTVQHARRSERDLLEEVLSLTRRLASDRLGSLPSSHPAWDDLFMNILELAKTAYSRSPDADTAKLIQGCLRPLSFIASRREFRSPGRLRPRGSLGTVLEELRNILPSDASSHVEQSQEE